MRVSMIALAACCIGGASLATALPSSLGATLNGVRSINQQQEPKPEARKTFTQQQPELMWTRNPDYAKFPAAACYGLGYRLANETAFDGLIHANISGPGKEENYDCLYLEAPNQFFTNDDGGSLNLGVAFDPTRCSFDSETADLTCTH
ncbi:hypothetical protein CSUB01_12041 [Colletotrichum sublineola]|uniref:DUF7888 domain-containing protein n=1 Tax=Colletotrichum sublineola TaxID=1173701 RepID=A0A066XZP5_COLSU|nr:hypothetical protein CSUB01_12041 [Colletotrichum sublineola]